MPLIAFYNGINDIDKFEPDTRRRLVGILSRMIWNALPDVVVGVYAGDGVYCERQDVTLVDGAHVDGAHFITMTGLRQHIDQEAATVGWVVVEESR